ncbi:MAG: hypothetical protein AMQ74_01624 [Candidatus Methanofastidiosum methylothiophilum]|uniref:Uncharacterized protein n=1 Tax=Candidatus Methanofastidiosum methylothiophilum TaxID=1705564 RepID=A0A150IU84_9EURY|nr:MAG: hypothetical protein AMQ74_01624 [Candidatus Methanofastidiosum methylthiophilus]
MREEINQIIEWLVEMEYTFTFYTSDEYLYIEVPKSFVDLNSDSVKFISEMAYFDGIDCEKDKWEFRFRKAI